MFCMLLEFKYHIIAFILIIVLVILLYKQDKHEENFDPTTTTPTAVTPVSSTEAIQNLSSMYNQSMLTSTNLNVTTTATIGNLNVTGNFNLIPRGVIVAFYGDVPAGWLLCDGTNGTPDLRGRFVLGASPTDQLDTGGGERTHTLTQDEMPVHSHSMCLPRGNQNWDGGSNSETFWGGGCDNRRQTDNAGGGQSHNNMPPYWVLRYIMKA